jgi:hypothetical protein
VVAHVAQRLLELSGESDRQNRFSVSAAALSMIRAQRGAAPRGLRIPIDACHGGEGLDLLA